MVGSEGNEAETDEDGVVEPDLDDEDTKELEELADDILSFSLSSRPLAEAVLSSSSFS